MTEEQLNDEFRMLINDFGLQNQEESRQFSVAVNSLAVEQYRNSKEILMIPMCLLWFKSSRLRIFVF